MSIEISFCVKCSDAKTKAMKDKWGIRGWSLVGCKKLTDEQWKDGLPKDIHETWNQKNCPLLKEIAR